jgi:hypothetical protein
VVQADRCGRREDRQAGEEEDTGSHEPSQLAMVRIRVDATVRPHDVFDRLRARTIQVNPLAPSRNRIGMRRLRILLDHTWARSRLSAYLDGELDERSQERLHRHANECEECSATLRALRHVRSALQQIGRSARAASEPARRRHRATQARVPRARSRRAR